MKPTKGLLRAERALLVAVVLPDEEGLQDQNLEELESLAATAGAKVVGTLVQRRETPHPAFYTGRGKVTEIHDLSHRLDADVVVINHDLTPAQVRNLEDGIQIKVIDRSELVLDIFATHARTTQAKLQVELAQLEYALPRLRRMWSHLSRYEGGIGVRGPGETQLETDRRMVRKRIGELHDRLKSIERRKKEEAEARSEHFTACLVGYTNAGKSSLMNALTGADVYVSDTPFATLDTKTSTLDLQRGKRVLISDTVGFIRDLPPHLVSSFHATLEEAIQADLLLHVVDSSSPAAPHHIDVVGEVLRGLGCGEKPALVALNKIDKERPPGLLAILKAKVDDLVPVSALTGEGLEDLRRRISELIDEGRVRASVTLDASDGKTQAYLASRGTIIDRSYRDSKIQLDLTIERRFLEKARKLNPEMEVSVRATGAAWEAVGTPSG